MDGASAGIVEALLSRGAITPAQVAECRAAQGPDPENRSLIDALVARGYLDPVELVAVMSLGRTPGAAPTVVPGTAPLRSGEFPLRIGPFRVESEIGRGAMGVVYKAWDDRLSRPVALKVLSGGSLGEAAVARFEREARTAARLKHPRIVGIHEVGEWEGRRYLAMDYVEGRTLRAWIREGGGDLREGARIVKQVAEAIAYAHEMGVVHRDLKPENVLLDAEGRAEVGDFGLARELDSQTRLTVSGAVLGTPAYMAPEQAEGRTADVGPATDVYGIGAVLYEVLAGRPPFAGAGIVEILYRVVNYPPDPPSRLNPPVPRDLEVICLKCLEKEPARRYAGAADVAEDLRRFLVGESILARPASRADRFLRWARKRRGRLALSLLVAAAIAVSCAMSWRARRETEARDRSVIESEFFRETEVLLAEAIARQRAGDPAPLARAADEAIARADAQIRSDPDSAAAWFVKGRALRLTDRPAEAAAALDRAVGLSADDVASRYQRGLVRAELHRRAVEEGQRAWNHVQRERHGTAAATAGDLRSLVPGLAALEFGVEEDFREVARLLREGRASSMSDGMAECGLGLLALSRGDLDEAERQVRRAIELDPFRDEALDAAILCAQRGLLEGKGDAKAVIAAIDRALQANRGRWSLRCERAETLSACASQAAILGRSAEALGTWGEARGDAEAAARLAPRSAVPRLVLAGVRLDEGRERDAMGEDPSETLSAGVQAASAAIELDPALAEAWCRRSDLHCALGSAATQRGRDPMESLGKADEDAVAASLRAPSCAEAHVCRGRVRLLMGRFLYERGKPAEEALRLAVKELDEALRLGADLPRTKAERASVLYVLADIRAMAGDSSPALLEEAIADLRGSLDACPSAPDLWTLLGDTCARVGWIAGWSGGDPAPSLGRAEEAYAAAIARNPRLVGPYDGRGRLRVMLGDRDNALGRDAAAAYEAAVDDFDHALELRPGQATVLSNRAYALLHLADWEAAQGRDPRDDYAQAAESASRAARASNASEAYNLLGSARMGIAQWEMAQGGDAEAALHSVLEAYTASLSRNPANWLAYQNRSTVHRLLGERAAKRGEDPTASYQAAIADLGSAMQQNPRNPTAPYMRAIAHLRMAEAILARGDDPRDECRRGISDYDLLERLAPEHAELHLGRGRAWAFLGRQEAQRGGEAAPCLDKALADFDEEARRRPEGWEAHALRGAVLDQMGRHDEALAAHEESERLRAAHPSK